MSEAPENLILVYLRRMDEKIDRLTADVQELKTRVTLLEQQVGHLVATEASHYAIHAARMDRMEARLDRIERRLDLVEPAR